MADQSPHAMAEAAYAAAVEKIERYNPKRNRDADPTDLDADAFGVGESCDDHCISRPSKTFKHFSDGDTSENDFQTSDEHDSTIAGGEIEKIWKSPGDVEAKHNKTLRLLILELDALVQCGLVAFQELDATSVKLAWSKEVAETRAREAERLHSIDNQSRSSLSNLLRAVEASKSDARDSSRAAKTEARLRAEVNSLREQRDKAISDLAEYRRKLSLNEDELFITKSKLNRAMQEKMCMERDSRQAISLARSLDSSNSSDMNYYRRKVAELSDKLQVAQDSIDNQKKQIAELTDKRGGSQRQSY